MSQVCWRYSIKKRSSTDLYDYDKNNNEYKFILDINNTKNITLPVGIYDRPQLFKAQGKSYVFFFNSSNSEIYAYDKEGNEIEGFPVIGQSLIDLKDIDKDKKLEFITQDDQKTLSIYRME